MKCFGVHRQLARFGLSVAFAVLPLLACGGAARPARTPEPTFDHFAQACNGRGVADAAAVGSGDPQLVYIDTDDDEETNPSFGYGISPDSDEEVSVVACITDDYETDKTCNYNYGGKAFQLIKRHEIITIELVEARTGDEIASETFEGEPHGTTCPASYEFDQYNTKVTLTNEADGREIADWLRDELSP